MACPYGDFFYTPSTTAPNAPLVLLSAGVGQTALLSILNSQLDNTSKPITYATVARDEKVHAFGDYLRGIAKEHKNVTYKTFYSSPRKAVQGKDYDLKGRMDLSKIKDNLHLDDQTTAY